MRSGCQPGIVGNQSLLRALIVVGGHQQQGVCSGGCGGFTVFQRPGGVIAAGPGDNRYPAGSGARHGTDNSDALLQSQGGGFAGGAAGNQRRRPALDLPFG